MAVSDDAVGRGRGVNRTAATPLDVHILADVALPLVHDTVSAWELVAPDVFQKMLLAGVAVDSPADAVALHPDQFGTANQAKLVFQRAGFKGQTSYKDPIREMTLKSAAYRRPGRGRGWQQAWWLDALVSEDQARRLVEASIGPLAGWRPRNPQDGLP